MEELRNKAKDAILSLLPYKVGFDQYVAEGVRGEILKSLFHELGLGLPEQHSGNSAPEVTKPKASEQVSIRPDESTSDSLPQGVGERPTFSTTTTNVRLTRARSLTEMEEASGTAEPTATKVHESKPTQSPAKDTTADESHAAKSPITIPVAPKTLPSQKEGSAKMERKDLILQKLAAKHSTEPAKSATAIITNGKASNSTSPNSEPIYGVQKLALASSELRILTQANPDAESIASLMEVVPEKTTPSAPLALVDPSKDNQTVDGDYTQPPGQALGSSQKVDLVPKPALDGPTSQRAIKFTIPVSTKLQSLFTPFTAIPGLFMTGPPLSRPDLTSNVDQPSLAAPSPASTATRKRPVAADFDAEPVSIAASFKRPFGMSRQEQPLVINVSEEESVDDEDDGRMDIDQVSSVSQTRLPERGHESLKRMTMRDMPPLTDLPPMRKLPTRKNLPYPISSPGTPAREVSSGKESTQENLKRAEREIQLMQKKIAELEQRKALQRESRAQTPAKSIPVPLQTKSTSSSALNVVIPAPLANPDAFAQPRSASTSTTSSALEAVISSGPAPIANSDAASQPQSATTSNTSSALDAVIPPGPAPLANREATPQPESTIINTISPALEVVIASAPASLVNPDAVSSPKSATAGTTDPESPKENEMRLAVKAKSEERTRRRAEIEMGLSQTRAAVEAEESRLEAIVLERQKVENSVQEALSRKQMLEEELHRLEAEDEVTLTNGESAEADALEDRLCGATETSMLNQAKNASTPQPSPAISKTSSTELPIEQARIVAAAAQSNAALPSDEQAIMASQSPADIAPQFVSRVDSDGDVQMAGQPLPAEPKSAEQYLFQSVSFTTGDLEAPAEHGGPPFSPPPSTSSTMSRKVDRLVDDEFDATNFTSAPSVQEGSCQMDRSTSCDSSQPREDQEKDDMADSDHVTDGSDSYEPPEPMSPVIPDVTEQTAIIAPLHLTPALESVDDDITSAAGPAGADILKPAQELRPSVGPDINQVPFKSYRPIWRKI
ncbi:MAG: hypothetical protein M1826_000771 [Phylliscum demangeonii]|nr:MAG: hypothetical protein M1826_000771 [Phylliscum demangeonii]